MIDKLVLHIGPHKTGSSYIQKTLFDHRQGMEGRGPVYPDAGMEFMWGHHALAATLYRGQFDQARRYLDRIQAEDGEVLLSSEDFDRLSPEQVGRLAELVSGIETRVVFVRRCSDELLVSTWQENVKNGGTQSWQRFFFEQLKQPSLSDIINPMNVLSRFEEHFGADALVIVDYDAVKRAGDDLFDTFAASLGWHGLKGLGSRESINAMMPLAQIEIIRLLNVLFAAAGCTPDCRVRDALMRYLERNPGCRAFNQLFRLIEDSSESMELSGWPALSGFEQAFAARYRRRVFNPPGPGAHQVPSKVYQLPRGEVIVNESSLRLLRLLEAEVMRCYVA